MEEVFCAVMLTMIFVQLARINLMPDYDSLHYGLRSHYILDAGSGIYENLGNINLVYTYPKGWEILSFPLSGTVTYGYQLCFSLWMAVLVLVLSGGRRQQEDGAVLRNGCFTGSRCDEYGDYSEKRLGYSGLPADDFMGCHGNRQTNFLGRKSRLV